MIEFHARGHQNVLATHKTTLEITKDDALTPKGDCIIAVSCDFDSLALERFAREHTRARMTLTCDGETERVEFELNPAFNDEREIVIRLGEHVSSRTLGVRANKAAKHLSRELIDKLKRGKTLEVTLEAIE